MLRQVAKQIRKVKWDDEDVANFLGCYLSEPKPHIFFDPPTQPQSPARFAAALQKHGLRLDLKTLMLCHERTVFINGEAYPQLHKSAYRLLRQLADTRELPPTPAIPADAGTLLYEWYLAGYLAPAGGRR